MPSRLSEHLTAVLKEVLRVTDAPANGRMEEVTEDWLARMEDHLRLIRYEIGPRMGFTQPPTPTREEIQCSAEGCLINWQTEDACLLQIQGVWYCRNHHPKLEKGQVRPVGWTPDEKNRAEIAASRQAVLDKLTPEERQYINSRMVV